MQQNDFVSCPLCNGELHFDEELSEGDFLTFKKTKCPFCQGNLLLIRTTIEASYMKLLEKKMYEVIKKSDKVRRLESLGAEVAPVTTLTYVLPYDQIRKLVEEKE